MTESMIERMATKMAELVTPPGQNPDSRMFEMLNLARVAVRELRRPTDLMLKAGLAAKVSGSKTMQDVLDYDNEGGALEVAFPAMIDAALQWPPGSADRAGVPLAKD